MVPSNSANGAVPRIPRIPPRMLISSTHAVWGKEAGMEGLGENKKTVLRQALIAQRLQYSFLVVTANNKEPALQPSNLRGH